MKRQICSILLFIFCVTLQAQLVAYPEGLKANMPHNDDYTVRVRIPGGEWEDLFEYNVQVDMDAVQNASMVQFDMNGTVEVMVKKNNGTVREVDIRPLSCNIQYRQNKNVITFMLDKPQYLSVEFNGDRLHNLHLFANPLETEVYKKAEKGIMYFGPGVHAPLDLPNNLIRVPGNTTVYLAPGAVLKAKLLVDGVENVRIIGRGILAHLIDNVFMRNSDDCIALYNHRWNWWGGSGNITVQNAVLWADIAHPINVGGHGDPESPVGEVMENLTFRQIDILEHDEDDVPYQGCMAIDCGDKNLVRNVLFEDIRVESIQEGRLFHLNVRFNEKYDKAPGRGIENVTFRNITYDGLGENPSLIKGFDNSRKVKNVIFDNVVINGQRMTDLNGFVKNEFVEDIRVR